MKQKDLTEREQRRRTILWSVLFGVIFVLGVAMAVVCGWYRVTYNLEFKELLYTLASPLKGTGESTISLILRSCLPVVLVFAALYIGGAVLLWKKRETWRYARRIGAVFCVAVLLGASVFSVFALRLPAYIKVLNEKTTVYEDYYVDPATVSITADGEMKNLIYIYLESMETTYASVEEGGAQYTNYMPALTALAEENISFSDKSDGLGGFHTPLGTGWTMSALLATTSGIPFSFPLGENGHNKMSQREYFASGLTTLGDILAEKGYRQEFLCGSDSAFAGRDTYFEQHGNYEVFDLYTAREEYYIDEDYYVWWGFEDEILYDIAKDELTELAAGERPFNFTMLTVDTHHVNGYVCDLCGNAYGNKLANVVSCADKQLADFIDWCTEQDFYEDTVIIITGDHPRMDTTLVADTDYYDRTIYNCFINAVPTPAGATTERVFTSFDLFPTTLAAMGFTIEGDRLGLGVNMFSDQQTLAEKLGYEYLETEINKFSDYYIREFS
ncbi:MAG: sulfatase-like hydrolase/transferase [Clostridia bacterium]|nr:sulfatase-like hydrolase/transferase [Clostridia bacterium]